MTVQSQFQKQCDHIAAVKQALVEAMDGRASLWSMVDAAGDETYENRVKGATISAVDTVLNTSALGKNLSDWFKLHTDYFNNDAGLTNIDTALASYKWRVSERFNEFYYDVNRRYLTRTNVFPRADLEMGSYARTGSAFTAGDAINEEKSGPTRISAIATAIVGGSNITVTGTLVWEDDSTISLGVTFTAADAIGTEKIFGEQALSANVSASQPVLSVASTAAFIAGQKVLIKDTSSEEWGTILSIVTNTSITLTANLKHAYTTAASAKVTPLFKEISGCTHTGGTNGDAFTFQPKPDRALDIEAT
jgi:hypothetical protein